MLSRLPERRVETASYDDADRVVSTTLQDAEGDITGFVPQTRSRQYDVRGRMVMEVDAAEGRTRLSYDRSDNLVSRTDPTSGTWRYGYDERNRLVEERGPEPGQLSTYQLDPNGNHTLATTPDGRKLVTQYDEHNRPVSRGDQLGQIETLTYTLRDELRRRTDGLGRVTRHDYDALGREVLRELPAVEAGARTLRWGFNALGDLLEETDAGGHATTHGYDGFGRRTSTRGPGVPENPAGHVVSLVLDGNGNPLQRTDARGVVTTTGFDGLNRPTSEKVELAAERYLQSWRYDVAGNLIEHVDRAGESTLQTFDRENRVLSQRRKSAPGAAVAVDITTTRNRYDAAGRLRFVTDALDEVTEYRYDRAGRRTHELRPLGFQRLWTYTPFDAVATYRDADGILTIYRHDVRQRLVEEEDAHGGITAHGYDAVGNRTATRRPAQTGDVQWEFGFDAADRLASVTSPEGHRTAYAYDPDGNRTHIDDANRHITRFDYDALHRLQQTTFADLTRQTREYDGNGNLLVLHHEGRRVESRYDALNREVQRSLVAGPDDYVDDEQPIGVLSSYDGNGRLIRQTQQRPAGDLALTRAWDALGRLVDESDWHAQPTSWTYDAVGTRTRRSDLGGDTLYQADRLHRVSQLSPPGAASLALEYTPEGRIAAVHHGDVASALYGYDALGRLEQLIHTQTSVEVARWDLTLDANGNREAEQLTTPDGIRETAYRYDEDDRLTGITSPETDTVYSLDPVGNRITQQVVDRATAQPAEDITYTYNARDQLETQQDAISDARIDYTYDAHGNLRQVTDSEGVHEYRHNVEDRLATLTLQGAPPVRYRYGSDGLRIAKSEGASETRFGYDQGQLRREHNVLGNLTEAYEHHAGLVLHQQRSAPTQRIALLHDTQRSPVRFVQQDGATAGTRRFDAWGEVLEESGAPTRVGYTGYYADAESGDYYAQQRYYRQGIGRFLSVDPWEGDTSNPITLNKYLYANGNPLVYVDPDGRAAAWLNLFAPEMTYAAMMASSDAEQSQKLRAHANQRPTFALGVGAMLSGAKLSVGALQLAEDVSSDDADAKARMAQRWAALRAQGEEVLPYAMKGPAGLAEYYGRDLASRVREDAAGLNAAIQQRDFVGIAESGTALAGDIVEAGTGVYGATRLALGNAGRVVQVSRQSAPRSTVVESETGAVAIRLEEASGGRLAQAGDADFVGPQEKGGWTLVPEGMGAHLIERVNVRGRPELASFDLSETPRYYPAGTPENAGRAHMRLHRATASEGIKRTGGNPELTTDELIDAYRRAYSRTELQGIRGDLRTPKGTEPVVRDVAPDAALRSLIEWKESLPRS